MQPQRDCSNPLVVFVTIRDCVQKGKEEFITIEGVEKDCINMYQFFLGELGLDIMYKVSRNGESQTKVDSKKMGSYTKDASKIPFKYRWDLDEIGAFTTEIKKWLKLSPRLYDGLIIWFSALCTKEHRSGFVKMEFYDTACELMDDYMYWYKFCGKKGQFPFFEPYPKILLFDVSICDPELEEVHDVYKEDKPNGFDMEMVIEQYRKKLNLSEAEQDKKRQEMSDEHNPTGMETVNQVELITYTTTKEGRTAKEGSKFSNVFVDIFRQRVSKQETFSIRNMLQETITQYNKQFSSGYTKNITLIEQVSALPITFNFALRKS